jgi:hypothetical protein
MIDEERGELIYFPYAMMTGKKIKSSLPGGQKRATLCATDDDLQKNIPLTPLVVLVTRVDA